MSEKSQVQTYLQERTTWQNTFDQLLSFGSDGVLKDEILQAKKIFFSKLGSVHEMKEDLFEATSQSFLEWYLYDYQTWLFSKSPAVVYSTLGLGSAQQREWIERSLFEHWSLYEVRSVLKSEIQLEDLLFKTTRSVLYDAEAPEAKLWKVKAGQIVQARLFELESKPWHLFTHVWIHPDIERENIIQICKKQSLRWSRHKVFLLECLEAVVRSHGLQRQLQASGAQNWHYQELRRKYA